jgi:hypothetical protein
MTAETDNNPSDHAHDPTSDGLLVRRPIVEAMSDEKREHAVDALTRLLISHLEREQKGTSEAGGSMQAAS